jgi:DNA sulfur modification protein DndC
MDIEQIFTSKSFPLVDIQTPGESVEESLLRSVGLLYQAIQRNKKNWIITYSGGKDSTLLTVIASEIMRREVEWRPESIDIIYCDTLEEIPPMHDAALKFLKYIEAFAKEKNLNIKTHITRPDPEQTYWFLLLGKGYPTPHRRFWWCTERLKINPVKKKLAELNHKDDNAVLTGVRFGESDRRDGKMKKASQCVGQGECGQVLEYHGALAPIAHWKTCHVWDMLALYAPKWGWNTQTLIDLYGEAPVRFGCWTCTLVEKDQALSMVAKNPNWQHFVALSDFRQRLLNVTADRNVRVTRPNGVPGRFKLSTRQMLLNELRALEKKVGIELISSAEEERIREYWKQDKGDTY